MRILHYINQFFGQIGGEEKADYPYEVRNTAVGPGLLIKNLLEPGNEIVATIICGDNYFNDHIEEITQKIENLFTEYKIDLLIAGPAFNAGRYGMACGAVCKIAYNKGISAVSGAFEENPGLELFRRYGYFFPTENNARGMKKALELMIPFVNKLGRGETILSYEQEGYYKRGIRKNIWVESSGAHRAINMALAKVNGDPFKTELEMPKFTKVKPSEPIKSLKNAKIALLTTGGIVPKGNPDKIESLAATKWKAYKIDDFDGCDLLNVDVAHGGYTPAFATNNGNRVLPLDAMLELEKNKEIGELDENIYVTVGNAMPVNNAQKFGEEIAQMLLSRNIDAAILTST